MKKLIVILLVFSIFVTLGCQKGESVVKTNDVHSSRVDNNATIKQDILCLMIAYPGYINKIVNGTDGLIYIIMKSGKKIIYDDKKIKTIEENFKNPDLKFAMGQIYPLSSITSVANENFGPGRARMYEILNEVYGASKKQVEARLVNVKIKNKNYAFNRNNGAAVALNLVMKELIPLTKKARINAFVYPISGTFNYRLVAGTDQLSPHSYGIAIDLAGNKAGYWRWTSQRDGERIIKSYPQEIVRIFEKNNFIWGGKWGHFDNMHFEYRPELILKSKYFGNKHSNGKPWYYGVPLKNSMVKKYVDMIDNSFNKF